MRDDGREARFGDARRQNAVASGTEVWAHPHLARLYQISVAVSGTAHVILPASASRHLSPGFCFAAFNHGSPGDGDIDFMDADGNQINFLDGSKILGPGECARVYLTGFTSEDVPTWFIVTRAAGAYAVP